MKITTITMVSILLLAVLVSAQVISNSFTKNTSIDKIYRDELLTKTNAETINPDITISCGDDYCKWSAYQENIIDSKDNKIEKFMVNGTEYSEEQLNDRVSELVSQILETFAESSLNKENYTNERTGDVVIQERK